MTATTSDAARRGTTKYTVCPRDRRPHPPSARMRSADSASEDKKKERLFRPTEEAAKCGEAKGRKWVLVKSPDHRMRSYKKKSKRRMKKGKLP